MMELKSRRSSGFTMIELVMVMVIVVILSVAVMPRFFSVLTYNRQVFSEEIMNSLRFARKLAVASGNHIQVTVTSDSITLQRRIKGSSCTVGTTFQPVVDPTSNITGFVRNAPANVILIPSSGWPIYFNSLGQAIRASDCMVSGNLTITIDNGETITLYGETGFVE
jgi:MSHA pilin protein MshC